ncbi:MAG: DUF3857 domain-containing protein [Bacteroidota bacterium]
MKKTAFLLLTLSWALIAARAQSPIANTSAPGTRAYGKIDMADLELTVCDFEKDANAMVLFDKGEIYYKDDKIFINRHKRVKIFNDNGKKEANVRIEFIGVFKYQHIEDLQAQTINLVNGKPEITKLDNSLIYLENTDKLRSAYVFTFPNVKPGSVLEFKYVWSTNGGIPPWSFQARIPTRYSVLTTELPPQIMVQTRGGIQAITNESTRGAAITNKSQLDLAKRSMTNVKSLVDEPYMTSAVDNLHSVYFRYNDPSYGGADAISKLWDKECETVLDDDDFGRQLNRKLLGEEIILNKAKGIANADEKIAYIFNEVRNEMKSNEIDDWYTNDGTVKAWEKKTGNSAEINLILYHLLKKAGIVANPMLVSTRNNGKVFGGYPTVNQFNRTVVSIPEPWNYVLDATGKFNMYNEIPETLLNNYALIIYPDNKDANLVKIERKYPVRQINVITADITSGGKMTGMAQLTKYSYNRINSIKAYKTDGEQKYIDYLRGNDNSIKISALKMENMEVDSLPLEQSLAFKMDLTGSDGNYIYFAPAMFVPLRTNPFLNETRVSDIDFGYRDNFSMVGNYKIPEGYKTDALPKNITVQMPDQSIVFKRIIGEQDGTVVVRYTIDYKKSTYTKDEYEQLYDFYKKLHELMNEQVVLKKA